MLDTMMGYDATGGGTLTEVSPTSLTPKGDGYIVSYFFDGISAEDLVVTCPTWTDWDPAGFKLPPTSDGTAVGAGDAFRYLEHKIPVKANAPIVMVATSGANPVNAGLHIEYSGGLAFKPRNVLESVSFHRTMSTTAAGTNCAAGSLQLGATRMSGFGAGKIFTPISVKANAAFTTTAFLGLRKYGGDNVVFVTPIPLTDVANDWKQVLLPHGLFTVGETSQIEVFLGSVTAEQPTADVKFAYQNFKS